MANLAASAVTILSSWTEGGLNGKQLKCRQVTVVLAAMGTVANKILASAFELTTVEQVENFIKSDNTLVLPAAPSYDGSQVVLANQAAFAPADVTGTFRTTVKGQ